MGEAKPHHLPLPALPKAGTEASLPRSPLWRHDLRQEPYAVMLLVRICAGGHRVTGVPTATWGTLKNELVHHRKYFTREQAKSEITECIEIFYNRMRKQKRLGYLSPAAFTQKYYANKLAA